MKKDILLVDDDADDRELFLEALAEVDSNIGCAFSESAEEAYQKLEEYTIDYPALIFLDINLPGISGWEFLKALKENEKYNRLPVIMYSTSSHEIDKATARDLGAVCLITKPSNYKALKGILSTVVGHMENDTYSLIEESIHQQML